jgi:exodeoxyribonuclease-1
LSPGSLANACTGLDPPRLKELLFRYRACDFAETLQPEDVERWRVHRAAKLLEGEGGARNVDQFFSEIDALAETSDEKAEEILGALYEYAEASAPTD